MSSIGVERISIDANGVSINNLAGAPGVVHNDTNGLLSTSLILNEDIATGTVTDDKLATITTAGKIADSALPVNLVDHTFNGQALAASAFSDTTNASNITSGTLSNARVPVALDNHSYNGVNVNAFSTGFGLLGGTSTSVQLTVTNDITVGGPNGSTTATLIQIQANCIKASFLLLQLRLILEQ